MEKLKQKALTFDDVLLLPRYSDFLPSEASTESKLTRNISLKLPLISAAMDTVTESRMAIALAEAGGIGIIHKNNSIEEQAQLVRAVKKYESGIVRDPVTISSSKSIGELKQLTSDLSISGMPVVDNGELKGIVTSRDFRYADNMDSNVSSIMTPFEKLVTVKEGVSQKEVMQLMYENRIEKVLVLDTQDNLSGLVTMKDIEKSAQNPDATKDESGRLKVGAALGTDKEAIKRAEALANEGVDVFVIDSAHGHSKNVIDMIKKIKESFKDIDVIAGNIATAEAAKFLINLGVDVIKVGIGPGSICTTRLVAGIGVPQLSAILNVKKGIGKSKTRLIADGGIKFSGDIAKALAAGADAVMIGSLFAGTDEAPGKKIKKNGKLYKYFRGMGSIGAMNKGSADRYFQTKQKDTSKYVAEGVEGYIKYKGKVDNIIYNLVGGLKSSMGYMGAKKVIDLRKKPKFVKITKAGFYESMVHNIDVIKK